MIHQKSKKVGGGSSRKSLTAVIKDPLKLFLLLASLVFVLGACSDGLSSNKDTKTQQPSVIMEIMEMILEVILEMKTQNLQRLHVLKLMPTMRLSL